MDSWICNRNTFFLSIPNDLLSIEKELIWASALLSRGKNEEMFVVRARCVLGNIPILLQIMQQNHSDHCTEILQYYKWPLYRMSRMRYSYELLLVYDKKGLEQKHCTECHECDIVLSIRPGRELPVRISIGEALTYFYVLF